MKVLAWLQVLICTSLPAFTQTSRPVPKTLFGVTLGGIYHIGDGRIDLGDIPIAKFAGMSTFLGHGIHYYFKPKSENKAFPYIEKRQKPDDEFFETSFRLYLLPVLSPMPNKNVQAIESSAQRWEVLTIEWSDTAATKDEAYYWTVDICKTFRQDLGVKPAVVDVPDTKWHKCTFASGDREFYVENLGELRMVQLTYKNAVVEQKDKAVESVLRKLRAAEIRPY